MENKDSYIPEEVVEIAEDYAEFKMNIRTDFYLGHITTAFLNAQKLAEKIPKNIGKKFRLGGFLRSRGSGSGPRGIDAFLKKFEEEMGRG